MFEAFYNLSDNPFRLTPDPKFCFRHPSHDRAHAYLQYALKLGEGFIMVTGRPGIGKTTLAQVFLAELEFTEVVAARVASVNVEATDLMRVVAYAYNIDVEGLDKATILVRLKQFFIDQTRAGKRVLLIIDEAQGLHYSALEELRLLADMQMGSRPLLQLFLVGQEKLRDLMQEPAMEQFQQRVIGVCHLEPLCLADTRDYMEHRFRKADWIGDPELTGEALLAIYQFSKGVPRHINKICTRLLLDGFMGKKHELNGDDVWEVAEALRAERLAPLSGSQAAATDVEDTGLVPELENGTLTLADLALRADPQQPPIVARPATPEAVAKVIETPEPRYTKQKTSTFRQTRPDAAKADSRIVSRHSGNSESAHRQRRRPYSAEGRFQHGQRQRTEQVRIPAWGSKSVPQRKRQLANAITWVKERVTEGSRQIDTPRLGAKARHYRNKIEQRFENHPWFEGRPGIWVGAMAVAALALTLTLLLDSADDDAGSHSVMIEQSVETAGVTTAAGKIPALIARVENREEFESASLEALVHEPVKPPVKTHIDDGRLVNNNEFSRRDGKVPGPTVPSPALTTPKIDSGSVVPDGKAIVSGGIDEASDSSGQPVTAASSANVAVAMSQEAAKLVQPAEDPVEEKGNALVGRNAVVTDSTVAVAVIEKSSVPKPVSREDRIIGLLSRAQRALRSDRLLIPADDNAYQYYQQVLKLEPGNSAALFGMDQIVERYVALSRKALDRQDTDKAKTYIARGSRVLPGDSRLVALQESMKAPEQPEVQVEVRQVAESKPKEKTPLSWFKEIFGKGTTADEKSEVPVEDYSY